MYVFGSRAAEVEGGSTRRYGRCWRAGAGLGAIGLAPAFILANRLADGPDGAVPRPTRPADRDALLDVPFRAWVPPRFALADPGTNALPP